ncbi:Helix-turn-helix domain-containing protein [Sinosporangium album]|uniref:Helix-turn-helix domain-containing protein n=1 Tax=Sinosporangium album TaxID=504805 RepID=A0A1G8IXM2_9ACTN|nr:helix-turn-helix transcriptional regulator [Sinosporangium album]SDI23795.1 Helix-turn-helix domain-containing protein [Sinosporangium album]
MAGIPGASPSEQAGWDLLGAQIKVLREANKLTLKQVAAHLHTSLSLVSKIECAQRRLPQESVEPLEQLFRAQGAILVGWQKIRRSNMNVNDGDISEADPTGNAGGMDEIRRKILAGGAGLAMGTAFGDSLTPLRELIDSRLGATRLADWEGRVWEYAKNYPMAELPDLASQIAADLAAIQGPAAGAPPYEALGWARLNARLTFLLAHTRNTCTGRTLEVCLWWETARRAAEQTGDPQMISAVHAFQANQALGERNPQVVTEHARAALRVADGRALPAAAEAVGTLAQISAARGDKESALDQLRAQEELFRRLPSETKSRPIRHDGWPEVRHGQMKVPTLTHLGHPGAEAACQEMLNGLRPRKWCTSLTWPQAWRP